MKDKIGNRDSEVSFELLSNILRAASGLHSACFELLLGEPSGSLRAALGLHSGAPRACFELLSGSIRAAADLHTACLRACFGACDAGLST